MTAEQCVIVQGPAQDVSAFPEKQLKKVIKEGGKRGVEIEGAADMGGLKFFCTSLLEPAGDLTLLVESMKAMNAKSDPSEEERKGGAGKLGKIIMTSTEFKISLCAYAPLECEVKASEWLKATVDTVLGSKAAVEGSCKFAEFEGISGDNYYTCEINNNPELNVFALKLRDNFICNAYNFLKAKGLFPEDDSEEEEDYVFGDEDFPEFVEEEAAAPVVERHDLLCPIAERLTEEKVAKKLAKIVKEGGKRGVEIEGAADMGGLQFFCTQMELPAGDVDCLIESMRAMNAKSDPSEEERKGGAGKIGKIILSMDDSKLCLVAYVPELEDCDKTGEISASEWLLHVVEMILKTGKFGEQELKDAAKAAVSSYELNEKTFAKAVIAKDGEKGLFPLKMKDECINQAYAYLKNKGLFPDGNDSDDDEMVFGDEDFPEF